uniref:FlgD Ig-like domain-containing protein n=1 Tax=candidate division WOR-3 bacterium TaxID=2052148 RepID=A0A7C4GAC8_UNCW3
MLLLSVLFLLSGPIHAAGFGDDFARWYQANSARGLGSSCSAGLAWFESHLLESCLAMFEATGNRVWLERFTLHADTMLAVAADGGAETSWPGYRDGFRGWGTTRYDRQNRYQEYLVHDACIGLPLLRFARMVFADPALQSDGLDRARRYVAFVEHDIIAKWYANRAATRGRGEELEHFGGWRNLPYNQFLAFGELLLLARDLRQSPLHPGPDLRVPDGFLSAVPDTMARLLKAGLRHDPEHDAYSWYHMPPTRPDPRPEDLAHANLVVGFVLEAAGQGMVFTAEDIARFRRGFTEVAWNGSLARSRLSRFVDGSGPADSVLALFDWVRLGGTAAPIAAALRPRLSAAMNAGAARTAALLAWSEVRQQNESKTAVPTSATDSLLSVVPAVFRSSTAVRYQVGAAGPVRIAVHDLSGRLVRVLVCGWREPGVYTVCWRGHDEESRPVAAGAFILRLSAPGSAASRRVVLLP